MDEVETHLAALEAGMGKTLGDAEDPLLVSVRSGAKFSMPGMMDTVLNLGAGLDTRPYRMHLPASLNWVEADYPQIIEHKENRTAGETARCRLERVKIDLADPRERGNLLASVNAQTKRILVVTEGVIPYLGIEEVASLADDIRALDHARYWVVDYVHPDAMKYWQRKGMGRAMQNAPFRFAPHDWFGFFQEHGWQPKEIRYLPEESARLRRPIPLPRLMKVGMKIGEFFLSRERTRAMREFMGYVLLEPA
jgi:methyltransferase (TIGR00027 family)